ncbi:MAG: putative signal transducing protein [Actinomycetota bacterium]
MARPPRPDGEIVELVNLPTRLEADMVLELLDANGIRAMAKYGDADGWAPHFSLIDGFRVCVFDDDLDAARRLLDPAEDSLPSEN